MTRSRTSQGNLTAPLVSVICRSINRPLLKYALQSVVEQSYRPVEVILVDSLGKGINQEYYAGADTIVRVVGAGRALARSESANLGLDSARGDYLMFLDDDDWIAPEHIAGLVQLLQSTDDCRAVYSSVRMTSPEGEPGDEVFDHDFDPVLLRRDNYIPIHAVLFHRSLLQGCRFDESLEIYEDWDFWLQVSRLTSLRHLDSISAFYRHGGSSDTAAIDHDVRFEEGHQIARARAKIYDKWKSLWSGAEINALIGSLDATAALQAANDSAEALHQRLLDKSRQTEEQQEQLKLLLESLEFVKQSSASKMQELQSVAVELKARTDQLESKLAADTHAFRLQRWHLEQNIQQLEARLQGIYRSPSWRLMGPFRRLRRTLDERVFNPLRKRIHYRRHGTEWHPPGTPAVTSTGDAPAIQQATAPGQDLKSAYRAQAMENLRGFLDRGSALVFPPAEQPRVSILLVLYNQAPLTLLCLESIARHAPPPYEVVIVDNASSDDTGRMLEHVHNARIIRNTDNEGFVRAVNLGAGVSRGEYLLLLNNDAMLHAGSIESALAVFGEVPRTGAVGGKILLLDGKLQEAGSIIFADGSCLGYGRNQAADRPEFMFRRVVDYCSGAFLMIPTQLFHQMGGFDEDYAPAYYEESDFCIRLHKHGLQVIYEPEAVITHFEFASSGGFNKASELQTSHRAILVAKHGDYLAGKAEPVAGSQLHTRSVNEGLKVLFIDDCVPHASLGSGYPRCREMIHVLAEAGVNLTFYPYQFPADNWEAVYHTLPRSVEVMLTQGRDGLPAHLQERIGYYDVIIVSRIHNMQLFQSCISANPALLGKARLIYDAEAVTAPREIRYRELLGEHIDDAEKYQLLHREIAAAELADTVLCVTDREAAMYHEHGFARTRVLGHSLTPVAAEPRLAHRRNLLFVGALRDENSPNVDSLHWFVGKVLPSLKSAVPGLRLDVVGDNSARSLREIVDPAVSFHGRQPQLSPFYEDNRVFVAPTRFAAGIPHKVHEAAAQGLPCVVTPVLAEQLGWKHEQEVLVADHAEEFSVACRRLLQDDDLWLRLRKNALARVSAECSPQAFRRSLLAAIGIEID